MSRPSSSSGSSAPPSDQFGGAYGQAGVPPGGQKRMDAPASRVVPGPPKARARARPDAASPSRPSRVGASGSGAGEGARGGVVPRLDMAKMRGVGMDSPRCAPSERGVEHRMAQIDSLWEGLGDALDHGERTPTTVQRRRRIKETHVLSGFGRTGALVASSPRSSRILLSARSSPARPGTGAQLKHAATARKVLSARAPSPAVSTAAWTQGYDYPVAPSRPYSFVLAQRVLDYGDTRRRWRAWHPSLLKTEVLEQGTTTSYASNSSGLHQFESMYWAKQTKLDIEKAINYRKELLVERGEADVPSLASVIDKGEEKHAYTKIDILKHYISAVGAQMRTVAV